jgi:hypothetical protein
LADRTSVKIGVTNGDIRLALLKQIWVTSNPLAVSPYPRHFGFVGRAANRHAERYGYNPGYGFQSPSVHYYLCVTVLVSVLRRLKGTNRRRDSGPAFAGLYMIAHGNGSVQFDCPIA